MPSKTVLITGCSEGGIGSFLALAFHKLGFHVFATARHTSKMSALKDLQNTTLLTLDVTNPTQVKEAVDAVGKASGGTLTYLVNNAALNHFRPILDEDIEESKRLFDTNVWSPLVLTQAFSPMVIKAKGGFVFITSIAGYSNTPWMGAYSASKISLEVLAATLRHEVAPFGVSVKSIVTGAVTSNGQTYFDDYALPSSSLYKSIEDTIASRARGEDGVPRMPTSEHAEAVVQDIVKGTSGKFWYGSFAKEMEYAWTPRVEQEMLDKGVLQGTGVELLKGGERVVGGYAVVLPQP